MDSHNRLENLPLVNKFTNYIFKNKLIFLWDKILFSIFLKLII